MIGCGKTVEFILAWQTYRVGDRIQPTAMDRDWLLRNGYVKDVEEVKSTAGVRGAVTRAIKGAAKRGADLLG